MLFQRRDLEDFVSQYKTVPAKKAALTRELKALEGRCIDMEKAYDRRGEKPYGWLLGDRIFLRDIKIAQRNIKTVEQFKNSL